jgi:hypothetical protein
MKIAGKDGLLFSKIVVLQFFVLPVELFHVKPTQSPRNFYFRKLTDLLLYENRSKRKYNEKSI